MHGTVVNDTPEFLLCDPIDDDHCVILQNKTLDDRLRIPLTIKGVSSIFPSRKTTQMEYEKSDHFIATSNAPVWDPHDDMFGSQESSMTDDSGLLLEPGGAYDRRFIGPVGVDLYNLDNSYSMQISSIFSDQVESCDATFDAALRSNVWIAYTATTPGDPYEWIKIG